MAKNRRQRRRRTRNFKPSAALVLDGKTEKWYFRMLQEHENHL